jgi:hypothetical protein
MFFHHRYLLAFLHVAFLLHIPTKTAYMLAFNETTITKSGKKRLEFINIFLAKKPVVTTTKCACGRPLGRRNKLG